MVHQAQLEIQGQPEIQGHQVTELGVQPDQRALAVHQVVPLEDI
jgi:hypothetical protein